MSWLPTCEACGERTVPPQIAVDDDTPDLCQSCMIERCEELVETIGDALVPAFNELASSMQTVAEQLQELPIGDVERGDRGE